MLPETPSVSRRVARVRWLAQVLLAAVVALGIVGSARGEPPGAQPSINGAVRGKNPVETITVEAKRKLRDIERAAGKFLFAVETRYLDDSLARWNSPICPLVAGLPREQGEFLLARVSQIVNAAKAPLDGPKCKPNLYIVVTREPDVLAKKWYARDRRMFASRNGMGYVKRFLGSTRPVRVWYHTGFVSPDARDVSPDVAAAALLAAGLDLQMAGVPVNITGSATRLQRSAVMSLAAVVVVVDANQLKELSVGQLADYVALVGLAEVNQDADVGSLPTILRLFSRSPDLPQGLSDWDQAFLRSLYTVSQTYVTQEVTMRRVMANSLASPQGPSPYAPAQVHP